MHGNMNVKLWQGLCNTNRPPLILLDFYTEPDWVPFSTDNVADALI